MTDLIEVNFDGIVGPTHHYGALGVGNLASIGHGGSISNPRAAALQGLEKIKLAASIADSKKFRLAVLPPQVRPNIVWLRSFGFRGSDKDVLHTASKQSPDLLRAAWSASSMWTANAATVSPASDCMDQRTHLTVANLSSSIHRSLEPDETLANLTRIFDKKDRFCVHQPLPGGHFMRDEGAANHMRLGLSKSSSATECLPGIEVFVYGKDSRASAQRFSSRQSLAACQAVARLHQLSPESVFYLEQHPDAVNAGAFHNDVVATSFENVLLYHEQAFLNGEPTLDKIASRLNAISGTTLSRIQVPASEVSLEDAVNSYLFNSQLIPNRQDGITIVAPQQCEEIASVRRVLSRIVESENRITRVVFADLRESMWNGGGPACLRLRVPIFTHELADLHQGVLWNDELADRLSEFVRLNYREHVSAQDLTDMEFAIECQEATRSIRQLLGLDP